MLVQVLKLCLAAAGRSDPGWRLGANFMRASSRRTIQQRSNLQRCPRQHLRCRLQLVLECWWQLQAPSAFGCWAPPAAAGQPFAGVLGPTGGGGAA